MLHLYRYLFFTLTVFCGFASAQEEIIYNLDEAIIVTASQIPTAFDDVTRSVVVLQAKEIALLPVQNVQDAIDYLAGVDVQQRGLQGVQGDVSIRGATFEQTLVMVDGVKLSDAQTGHHNMNLPLALGDIEKIEVLKGPASRHLGPNAFGGVINIITRFSAEKKISLATTLGEDGYYEAGTTVHLPLAKTQNRLSLHKSASNGYRANTDFDTYTVSLASRYDFATDQQLDFLGGVNERKFGANSFYSARFPNQWEKTNTYYLKSGWKLQGEHLKIQSRVHFRVNDDEFLLKRENPSFYHNKHHTQSMGADLKFGFSGALGASTVGLEWQQDQIKSNNLGSHLRAKSGVFLEHQYDYQNFRFILSGSAYQISDWGWNMWPGFDFRYKISEKLHLFGSLGKAFRVPTFTELYYSDPANRGNSELKEEQAMIYEAGIGFNPGNVRLNLALFRRNSSQLIDWVWQTSDSIWQVQNLFRVKTNGLEGGLEYYPAADSPISFIRQVSLQYTYIQSEKDLRGKVSKYALSYLRHQAVAGVVHKLIQPVTLSWKFRFGDRLLYKRYLLTDVRISWKYKRAKFLLDVNNLFNVAYEDYFDIPLPGRKLSAGFNLVVL